MDVEYGWDEHGGYERYKILEKDVVLDLGSLEPGALAHLSGWREFRVPSTSHGFYHRVGVKSNLVDDEGDQIVGVLHFAIQFGDSEPTAEAQAIINENLAHLVNQSVHAMSEQVDNVFGTCIRPPDYMLREIGILDE